MSSTANSVQSKDSSNPKVSREQMGNAEMQEHALLRQANRRQFLVGGTAASIAGGLGVHSSASAQESNSPAEHVKIALIGAGSRGSGAVLDSLSINKNISLVSIADIDARKPALLKRGFELNHPEYTSAIQIDDNKVHSGIDGYRRVLDDSDVDVVLFATPPGFRASHLVEAVDAGKHVFAEKPTCIDPNGYRQCLAAHEKAVSNKTSIVTGTQYRRQTNYIEAVKRIHDGDIGDIVSATSRYCTEGIWYKVRRGDMSDTEYQIYNWMHFIWLSGDQISEQAVHNIDLMNWLMKSPPELAFGCGGRFTRPDGSEMWDSMSVDYRYPGDRIISFTCRQIPGAKNENATEIFGTQGRAVIYGIDKGAYLYDQNGKEMWSMKGDISAAYQQEHKDLIDSVRSGKPIVELAETAASSLTAVLGRLAAYTGQEVSWDFVTKQSQLNLFPDAIDMKAERSSTFAIPGKTKLS